MLRAISRLALRCRQFLQELTQNSNTPVQSIQYRSNDVIFEIQPTVKGNSIDLKIKRDLVNDVTVKNGEVIVLGGLAQDKDNKTETGLSFSTLGFPQNDHQNIKTSFCLQNGSRQSSHFSNPSKT